MRITASVCCVALVLAAGLARGQSIVEEAAEARQRGAIFESDEILQRAGDTPSAGIRVEQAINAYYLGRYRQAREILAGVLADPAAPPALKSRAVAWVVRINRHQLSRMARKPFNVSSAFGIGSDSNANNVLDSGAPDDSGVPDDFDSLPDAGAPERSGDTYVFYRAAAGYAVQPAEPANMGGYPFAYRWTGSASHYGRRFNEVSAWDARYTQLAGALRFEKHKTWAGSLSLSVLDYRLDNDRLVAFGSVAASYKRLLQPVNLGVQAAVQRLDYQRAAWSGRTGNRIRVQLFVEGAIARGHSFRAGIEPQRFHANAESRGYRGFRAHLLHVWQVRDWRLHNRLIYEKNKYGDIDAGGRRDSRFRFAVNLVRPFTERLFLSLAARYLSLDSSGESRDLSKTQLELSVRYRR